MTTHPPTSSSTGEEDNALDHQRRITRKAIDVGVDMSVCRSYDDVFVRLAMKLYEQLRFCRRCGKRLIEGETWAPSRAAQNALVCKSCDNHRAAEVYKRKLNGYARQKYAEKRRKQRLKGTLEVRP